MEHIDIETVHRIVLSIAKQFEQICSNHSIPYYMLGGTMLGAVRHHGFIPWDDDMDFGVPYEYYKDLESILLKELPFPYRCCTFRNHPAAIDNFIKIDDQTTRIDDRAIDLPIIQQLGVNVDVFPLVRCNEGDYRMKIIRQKKKLLGSFYLSKSHPNSVFRKAIKKTLQGLIGGKPIYMQRSIDKTLSRCRSGNYLGNLLGHWEEKEIIPIEWYGEGKRYKFEDTTFIGIEQYDKYLTRLYGNYMELPPLDKQIAHVNKVYLL